MIEKCATLGLVPPLLLQPLAQQVQLGFAHRAFVACDIIHNLYFPSVLPSGSGSIAIM
jgi:hypothetical protein